MSPPISSFADVKIICFSGVPRATNNPSINNPCPGVNFTTTPGSMIRAMPGLTTRFFVTKYGLFSKISLVSLVMSPDISDDEATSAVTSGGIHVGVGFNSI